MLSRLFMSSNALFHGEAELATETVISTLVCSSCSLTVLSGLLVAFEALLPAEADHRPAPHAHSASEILCRLFLTTSPSFCGSSLI